MKRKSLAVLVIAAALSLAFADAADATDWPQFHHGADHVGVNVSESTVGRSNVSALTQQWATAIGPGGESSPAVVNGIVYVGSDDANLYAVDAASGQVVWSSATGGPINLSSPAVDAGRVFVGSTDQKLYAFDASTGAQLWSATTGGTVEAPPSVANGVVYAASDKLYAFDAASGALNWSADTGGPVAFSSPTVAGGRVYVGAVDQTTLRGPLEAFDAASGTRLWTATTFGAIEGAPAVVGTTVYVASGFGVEAFDAATGATLWTNVIGSDVLTTPAVDGGLVYITAEDGTVRALDAATGATVWNTSVRTRAETFDFSSPALANGVLYVGGSNAFGTGGQLWALNSATGAVLWSGTVGGFIRASVAVVNGHLYAASDKLYAFALGSPDTTPPTISVPADITVAAAGPAGAVVSYFVSVTDDRDPNPSLSCTPPSGSTFPLGTTTVTCVASDFSGNTSTATFTVTVVPPLDISLQASAAGSVNLRSGVATVRGAVACNRATFISVSGDLKQTIANRAVLDGTFFTSIQCVPPASPWSVPVSAPSGRYVAGQAQLSASASACELSCDFDSVNTIVTLRG